MRLATQADVPRIVGMVEALRAAVRGVQAVDGAWAAQTLARLIASPDGAVWLSDGGFLAASLQRTVINPAPVAIEHGWWAADGSGLRLLRTFERWARERGATAICLSTGIGGPDLSRICYTATETAWVKVI